MGQYAVILTISAILLGGVLLFNARAATSEATAALSAYQTDRIAREASQIALRDVVRKLNARPDEWTSVLSLAQARFGIDTTEYVMEGNITTAYAVRITEMYLGTPSDPTDPDRVRLEVNGAFDSWNETTQSVEPTDFIVEAVYERGWVDVNVPGGFRHAIWSNGCIDLDGSVQISGSLHTNACLTSSSSSFDVYDGTGTYTGSESADDAYFHGDPPLGRRDSVLVPTVGLPSSPHSTQTGPWTLFALGDPTNTNPPGDSLIHGWLQNAFGMDVVGKGTATDPYILLVSGDLIISGPVRLPGHIRIYVDGSLIISDDASLTPVWEFRPSPSGDLADAQTWAEDELPGGVTLGLYVSGNVTLGARTFLAAMLYTYGSVTPSGTGPRMLVGGVLSHQPMNLGGDTKIYYKEGADSVYDPIIPRRVPEGIRLVSYREWAERPS